MKIKTSKGLKVVIIAVALLLCLALAIGITGAFYQAKRQATGTLSMDQGIIIDYKGFGKTPDEGIWTRETTTTFLLFNETNAQPGEQIAVNAAGIRANEKSVNFYARVKLSYKFYNGETPVELADATKLIKTSSSFFGTNWVESGDGYYYYATGSTLNKFAKTATTFVELFATDAKFVIEGAGFTGSDNDGESGGFVVGDTSINKIEVYLTLETLQGDATAEQAKALGWEITTGGTEGEKVVELTPEDYTSTTTTDAATGEEKTIYTPSETFVGKNPKYAFTFSLNDTDKTATITGPVGKPTELDIPSKLIVKGKDYTTTSIGKEAFFDCSSLTSVTIGNGVTSIGESAFGKCVTLTTITIPNSVTSIGVSAFGACKALTSITIPDSVTSIGNEAFVYCSNLTSVTVGNSVKSIGESAFAYCSNLKSIEIPEGVESIGGAAFGGCKTLTSITIPNSVTSIEEALFAQCWGLTSVTIGNSVKSIGNSAFNWCDSLTSIIIPDSVESIGEKAFWSCTSLTSITIGNSVKSIEQKAFDECYALAEVYNLSNYITVRLGLWNDGKIGTYAKVVHTKTEEPTRIVKDLENGIAYYVYEEAKIALTLFDKTKTSAIIAEDCTEINQHAFEYCSSLTSVTIPSSVKSIGEYAFMYCRELTTITIESGVTSIGDYVFQNCEGLTSITFPDSVTSIGYKAFENCSGLTSVTIGNGVNKIGAGAFYGCSGLTSVTIGSGVTSIGADAFFDCTMLNKVNITDIAKWCEINFGNDRANPLYYAHNLYLNNELITEPIIPDGVTSIGDYVFYGCSGLTSITIPNSVTSIGKCAFYDCSGLTAITIPDSVTSIGSWAYFGCSGLTSIHIGAGMQQLSWLPDNVSEITITISKGSQYLATDSKAIFAKSNGELSVSKYISADTTYDIPAAVDSLSVTSIGESAFSGCSGLTSITIPDTVTSIGKTAFQSCSGLTSVTIGNSVKSIGYYAFAYCKNLTSIEIPEGVESIGENAFSNCSGLTSITIPNSVTSIGYSAFYNCSSLTSVTIDSATIAGLGSSYCYLLNKATKVYVKDGLTVGTYITNSFTKAASSDKYGYDMYTKKA